jgi:hypothetical protein
VGCLVRLLALLAFVAGLVWVALPIGAGWLVTNALGAAGFHGTATVVDVNSTPPYLLLVGHADTVRIRSNDIAVNGLRASTLDLRFGKVDLFSRSIGTVDGTLTGVQTEAADGEPLTIDAVTLTGSATATQATMKLSLAQAQSLAATQLAARGLPGTVALAAPDKVTITALGHSEQARLVVSDGSLIVVPATAGSTAIPLITPSASNPFRVTGVAVAPTGLTLTGTVDVAGLLGI